MKWLNTGVISAVAVVLAAGPSLASTLLTNWNQSSLSFITDGTSNTIAFTESSHLAMCFQNVSIPSNFSTTDGTSNTILFGESNAWAVHSGFTRPSAPIGSIADGTSNTIFIGEISGAGFCLGDVTVDAAPPSVSADYYNPIDLGDNSRFDVCADNVRVGTIQDGTSNTILFGETPVARACFESVQVSEQFATAAPEPAAAPLLVAGALGLFFLTRRHRPT